MHRSRDHVTQKFSDTLISENLRIAHIYSWKSFIFLAALLFTIFYWMIPAWLNHELMAMQNSTIRPIAETLFVRRIHWFQLTGISLGLICTALAIRNYFVSRSSKTSTA